MYPLSESESEVNVPQGFITDVRDITASIVTELNVKACAQHWHCSRKVLTLWIFAAVPMLCIIHLQKVSFNDNSFDGGVFRKREYLINSESNSEEFPLSTVIQNDNGEKRTSASVSTSEEILFPPSRKEETPLERGSLVMVRCVVAISFQEVAEDKSRTSSGNDW
eukprot:gene19108-biopygen5863